MSGHFYRRDGKPIDLMTWARLMQKYSYKIVQRTTLEDGTLISTVWLGLDHSFSEITGEPSAPIIFETMVFSPESESYELNGRKIETKQDWAQRRYATEAEAIAGHHETVLQWKRIREQWKNLRPLDSDKPTLVKRPKTTS